jgi:hypothetical protein
LKNKEYPFEVFGAGFGFIAMKSGVFESCRRPWFETEFHFSWGEFNNQIIFRGHLVNNGFYGFTRNDVVISGQFSDR